MLFRSIKGSRVVPWEAFHLFQELLGVVRVAIAMVGNARNGRKDSRASLVRRILQRVLMVAAHLRKAMVIRPQQCKRH